MSTSTIESLSVSVASNDLAIDQTLLIGWPLPIWIVALSILAFALFAVWIYRTERGSSPAWIRWLLAALRFSLLLIVLWMLTQWSWQRSRIQRPDLIIAVDVSDSMLTRDAAANSQAGHTLSRLERANQILSLSENEWLSLHDRYRLKPFLLAEDALPMDFTLGGGELHLETKRESSELLTHQSRLGEALGSILDRQAGRGTAAVLLLSDGIVTAGQSLSEAGHRARQAAIPIHTIAIGRQLVQPDLRISEVLAEDQVYLGDQVSIEATVLASDIADTVARVQLKDLTSGQVVDEQFLDLTPSASQATATLRFVPAQAGEADLQVVVDGLPGETDIANNQAGLKLDVQDRIIRVLMIFDQPSYEFRFLKHFLERVMQGAAGKSAVFELTSILQSGDVQYIQQDATAQRFVPNDPTGLSKFDVFVLGNADPNMIPRSSQLSIVQAVTHAGAGCLFLGSNAESIQRLADYPLGMLLPIEVVSPVGTTTQGYRYTPTRLGLSAFSLDWNETRAGRSDISNRLPTIQSVLGVESIKPGAQVLAEAESVIDGSRRPLMTVQFAGAGRTCLLSTDETYRWTTAFGSDTYHQRFWGQTLRWLCRGKLNAVTETELMIEPRQTKLGTPVRFQLRLPLGQNLPEQTELRIENSQGFNRSIGLTRVAGSSASYLAVSTDFPPGEYRAVVTQPALANPPSEEFSVTAPQSERAILRADRESMKQLAEISRGRAYEADHSDRWYEHLPAGRSVQRGYLPPQPIWNQNWVAMLFVCLITAEWLVRRQARML